MTPVHNIDAALADLPTIPPDAGPEWRDFIRLRDLLLRAKGVVQNIRTKEARI